MKAIRVYQYGTIEELKLEEAANPAPGAGQVLVRNVATSVNPFDHKVVAGQFKAFFPVQFPWTPGSDFSGVIEAVGPGVTRFKKGDEVFGLNPGMAAYAELLVAPEAAVLHKPAGLTHFQAASLATVSQTAWQALFEAGQLKAGQRVLIHAGAGGVGTIAIQLAHRAGVTVYTTASAENRADLLALGADEVIDYRNVPFESVAQGMDVVIDAQGGEVQQRSFASLKPGGILISIVHPPSAEEAQKRGVTAVMMTTESSPARLEKIAALAATGELKTIISKVYPLAEVKDAWQHVVAGHAKGKIVIKI